MISFHFQSFAVARLGGFCMMEAPGQIRVGACVVGLEMMGPMPGTVISRSHA